ncbi:MAG: leucine-rich repeat protein [Clostridia bacterium]|nr:leucine-rich repeat protein [Clostridia bacterium]
MKRKLSLILGILLIMTSMAIGAFAAEESIEGFSFAPNELWEVENSFNELPLRYEAKIYPTDTTVESVIIGNYCKSYDSGFDLRLAEGGIPKLYLNNSKGTIKLTLLFEDVVIPANEWSEIAVEYDSANTTAKCYVGGTLKSTIDLTDKTLPTVSPDHNIIVGGNRVINSNGTHNESYFRGYIESVALYTDVAGTAPMFKYVVGGEGNTATLMKDQSGAGNDAIHSDVWSETSGIEDSGETYAYKFAVVGDPQTMANADRTGGTTYYTDMYKWIVTQNPNYVITLGDIIHNGADGESAAATAEWAIATEALGLLDAANIPHSDIKGNHCTRAQVNKYLPYAKYYNAFEEQGVKTICYEESMLNAAHLFTVNDVNYMVFALDYGPSEAVLGWAGQLCEIYSDYNVIVTTHSYLGRDGTTLAADDAGDATEAEGFTTGDEVYDWFIDKYPNIVMVLCGHIAHDNVVVTQRTNSAGTKVTEMLIDFQDVDGKISTAVGMVNMFNFSADGKTVYVETYSTAQKSYYKSINQIKLELDTVEPENEVTPVYEEQTASGTVSGYDYTVYGDTLVISGKGTGVLSGTAPALSGIKTVVIENSTGIKEIGASFFSGYSAVETVVIPETLKTIGSKAFAGMPALTTVALFNEYYAASGFAGTNIIDIDKVFYLSADSFSGSGESATAVYISEHAEISGNAAALIANSDAVYYTYPSGNAAQYMRSLGDAVVHEYYTYEMTGDKTLKTSDTAYLNGGQQFKNGVEQYNLTWSFDITTGTLTVKQGNVNSIRMSGGSGEFDNWKRTWNDLVTTLSIGSTVYSMWESYDESNSVPYGLTNVETIKLAKSYRLDDRHALTGFFENMPNLKSITWGSSPDVEEGVIDLTWWFEVRRAAYDGMFRNCTSMKGIVFPETITVASTAGYFRIYPSMFENCVNLESITIPSYAEAICANAFAGCTSLSEITIKSIGFTVEDKSAFPDQKMTIYVQTKADKATIDALGYENVDVVALYDYYGTMASGYTWTMTDAGLLTISGTGDGTITFDSVPTADDYSAIAWYEVLDQVTSVVIEESTGITSATAYAFSNMPNCTTITLPTTFTDFTTDGLFVNDTALTAITQQGTEATAGVIDLRSATAIKASAFANISCTIWIGDTAGATIDFTGVSKTDSIKFMSYPTCDAADDVRAFIKESGSTSVTLSYYSVDFDSTLVREGAQDVKYTWVFDETTGILTITVNSGYELVINNQPEKNIVNIEFLTWKNIWRDAIVKIQVTGSPQWGKMQINHDMEGFFEQLPNLEAVLLTKNLYQWQINVGHLFYNCSSLTTLDWGTSWDGVQYGTIDLTGITQIKKVDYAADMFSGCTSITNVDYNETATTNCVLGSGVYANMFKDCTSLVSITLPSTVTTIVETAFDGCTNLKSIVLEGETVPTDLSGVPDKEGFLVICSSADMATAVNTAGAWEYTKAVYFDGNFDGNITMFGFNIRNKTYNGIRGNFRFSTTENAILEAAGYELVEYGTILMTEEKYNEVEGPALTLTNGVYTVNAGQKVRVYSAEDGFKRDNGDATYYKVNGDLIEFNVSVVEFTSNYNTNIYMCGYSVYIDPNGETVFTYNHYSDDYKFFNLYDITLDMYKAGAINASVSDDAAVWNTLLTGVVTLESGDIYKEIPACGANATTYTPVDDVTVTLVKDSDGNYVAIYRGTGDIPSIGLWNNNNCRNQLHNNFSTITVADGYTAIPVLSAAEATLVKTIIIDDGITAISGGAFLRLTAPTTYVYATSVKSFGEGVFFKNSGVTTMYPAHVDQPNKKNVSGLVDLSAIESVSLSRVIQGAVNVEKLHLPESAATVTTIPDWFAGNDAWGGKVMKIKAIWFGDDDEPTSGVIDFSNTSIKEIANGTFKGATSITKMILPDSCDTIHSSAFYGTNDWSGKSSQMTTFTDIVQTTYNEGVASYCTTNGVNYTYTTGGPTDTTTETTEG